MSMCELGDVCLGEVSGICMDDSSGVCGADLFSCVCVVSGSSGCSVHSMDPSTGAEVLPKGRLLSWCVPHSCCRPHAALGFLVWPVAGKAHVPKGAVRASASLLIPPQAYWGLSTVWQRPFLPCQCSCRCRHNTS